MKKKMESKKKMPEVAQKKSPSPSENYLGAKGDMKSKGKGLATSKPKAKKY